ncbi:VTT domain-containing protein [uncultured Algimonas sp.]|uniref:TVP38/TMEM64 family protein n=1 Tax=uncultured Algimonas sp. TaxID=1547920 RepID=UPI0026211B76|nr:VTT domain-containing protein [uncultured Algimonas sp.]
MKPWLKDAARLAVFALAALAVYWVFHDQVGRWVDQLGRYADSPVLLLVAIGVFLVGSFFLLPQWVLIAAAIAAFGFLQGAIAAWIATMFAAHIHLGIAILFRDRLRARLSGPRMTRLRTMFSRNSFQSGLIVRMVPAGPFILVNLAAGLAGARAVPFLSGTAIGIMPKIVLTGLVAQGVLSSAQGRQVGLWVTMGGFAMLGLFLLSRWSKSMRARQARNNS